MKIGICDDAAEIREMLVSLIKRKYPEEEICLYSGGEEVLLEEVMPDILFLDIEMPGIDGMETAKRLRQRGQSLCIIFVTVMSDMVFEAFDVEAFHYLVKPFAQEKLYEVLERAAGTAAANRRIAGPNDRNEAEAAEDDLYKAKRAGKANQGEIKKEAGENGLACTIVKQGGVSTRVCMMDIIYAEVFNRKVLLHTKTGDIEYYGRLSVLEKQAGEAFFRPHRSYLVNMAYIEKYDARSITTSEGEVLLARKKYREFVRAYLKYCKGREAALGR